MSTAALPTDTYELARACVAHLDEEASLLDTTAEFLRDVRAALIRGDLAALAGTLERQAEAGRAREAVSRRRTELRQMLAHHLGVEPAAVTLTALAARLAAADAADIASRRDRLRAQAAEVARLNRATATLLAHSAGFLQRLLVALSGGDRAGDRYDPAGRPQAARCGSFIEARG